MERTQSKISFIRCVQTAHICSEEPHALQLFECGGEPSRGLQSGFLKHHVMMSLTISYEGQAGQKCRGWLSCCYIFLRAKHDYGLHMSAKAAPLEERAKWLWVSCELGLSLAEDVADGPGPPTARHGGTTSTALKNPKR